MPVSDDLPTPMTKRVLIPVSHPLGGIRTYMLYSFKPLHEAGFRFTFLSEAGVAFESFKKDVADWEDTRFVDVPQNGGSKATFLTIRKTLKEQQFALMHSQGLRAGTEAAAANYFRRMPHLITLHDVIVPGNDIPGRFRWLKKRIMSATTRRATAILPVSYDCEANHLEIFPAWRRGPVKIQTIPNGIDIRRIESSRAAFEKENRAQIRERFDIAPETVLGGFFGRFMPQKGFDILLKAMSILGARGYGERFLLVATKDMNGYLNETIAEATEKPEIARMIRFIDAVPEIAPLLCQMDLLVMPSRWEACGLLAMEAMVLGIPVIGSNCLGLREVLRETPSIAPEKENPEALAEALMRFIDRPTTSAAKEYAPIAAERFDVRVASEKLLELYGEYATRTVHEA